MSRFKKKNTEIIHEDADRELFIDDENLNRELLDQPLLFRKWVKIKSQVNKNANIIKEKLKQTEAKVRLQYAEKGGRVKEIDSKVELDESVAKLRLDLIEAQALAEEYDGIARAFYQRHETLKELCANVRKEMAD